MVGGSVGPPVGGLAEIRKTHFEKTLTNKEDLFCYCLSYFHLFLSMPIYTCCDNFPSMLTEVRYITSSVCI